MNLNSYTTISVIKRTFYIVIMLCFANEALAAVTTIGGVATQVIQSFKTLARLITASSYLAGLAFSIGAIMKFKQHKDNPTQIPIGTPIALILIAAALLFLPSILKVAGGTMFEGGKTAGPGGTVFTSS
jgi:intracellular multiplication protein IcmD